MPRVTLLYFASLRDAAGMASEVVDSAAPDLRGLYREAQARHGFAMPLQQLRVAANGAFVGWDQGLEEGAEIAFIPPVSGG
jgi:molybdopterin synthase sulfur carrier subunit